MWGVNKIEFDYWVFMESIWLHKGTNEQARNYPGMSVGWNHTYPRPRQALQIWSLDGCSESNTAPWVGV